MIVVLHHQRNCQPGRREVVAVKGYNFRDGSWHPGIAFDLNSPRPLPDWIQSTVDELTEHWIAAGTGNEPERKSSLRLFRCFKEAPSFEMSEYLVSLAGRHLPQMCKSPVTGTLLRIVPEPENGMNCFQIIADGEQLEEVYIPLEFKPCVKPEQAVNVGDKLCSVTKMTKQEYEALNLSEVASNWLLLEAWQQLVVQQADGTYLGDHRLFKGNDGVLEWEKGVQRVDFSWELLVNSSLPPIDLHRVPEKFANYFTPAPPPTQQAQPRKYATAS